MIEDTIFYEICIEIIEMYHYRNCVIEQLDVHLVGQIISHEFNNHTLLLLVCGIKIKKLSFLSFLFVNLRHSKHYVKAFSNY